MEIGPIRNEAPVGRNRLPGDVEGRQPHRAAHHRTDGIVISGDTRSRLAELADRALDRRQDTFETPGLDPAADPAARYGRTYSPSRTSADPISKLAGIRQRMALGFYDRPEVKKKIADQLADQFELTRHSNAGKTE